MSVNKRFLTVSIAAALVSSFNVQAAGFQLNSQSATGLGRAFSGDAVIADNASVVAKNAAAMALFDRPAMSLGLTVIDTDIKVKNTSIVASPFKVDDASIGGISYVPNLYYIHPINEKIAVGASLYSNFGTLTEFPGGYGNNVQVPELKGQADIYGGTTEVKSLNLGLSASYRLNKQLSLGAGIDVIYGSGKFTRGRGLSPLPSSVTGTSDFVDIDADGFALGFNLGSVFEVDDNNRFGLTYRFSPTLEAKGDMTYIPNAFIGKPYDLSGEKLKMPLPDMAEFSGFHKLNDKFAVHYSIQWIGWSSFDKLETTGGTVIKDYEWQDGWHYAIGGTYYLNNDWTLRAGYMHDTSAQDQMTSISVPDSDRNWISGGFTYHLDSKSNIDFGLTYLMGKDVDVKESQENGSLPLTATTRANAWLYGIQYSRSF
ncbi:aromatic hydrocarbon degradation protein [Photobacterium angustum]|uniref:outer membrane protein transport protein n=1 Tax=Photobacterium angustum TaxID=661 RepID=UPI0005DC16F9|nr:outer membrane protein transport protein [Photobacterium angustum]KJF95462.1 aromatic hydrocarbon degradation protein [Photobacterium angustum]KJG07268.1 aromatic hydrocarbon degradation protein [Photobacterium angustum]PSV95875.1 aromatic hydrocarbon degradation protein [Photobacterium angustum]PSW83099.1 aromatic hydrocarbon degradation protein [Photobacterium angustum]